MSSGVTTNKGLSSCSSVPVFVRLILSPDAGGTYLLSFADLMAVLSMSSSESESESLPFRNLLALVFGLSSPSDISSSSSDESSESESSSDESSSDEVSPVANMPPPPPDLAGLAAALSLEAAPSAGREPELETDSLSDESESSEREPEAKNDIVGVEWGRGRGVQVGGRGEREGEGRKEVVG